MNPKTPLPSKANETLWRRMLAGFRENFFIVSRTPYVVASEGGFAQDAAQLAQDWQRLGDDMRAATRKAYEQTNRRAR